MDENYSIGHDELMAPQTVTGFFGGITYENPFQTWNGLPSRGNLWRFIKERWNSPRLIPPEEELEKLLPIQKPDQEALRNPPADCIQYMWVGHATVLYQMEGWNILTDPIWSGRCSPVQFMGPKRYRPPPLSIAELPDIDVVVISHNHYDHLDRASVEKLNGRFGNRLKWVVPVGLGGWFASMSCRDVTELNWWQSKKISKNGKSLEVVCTPAQHWSLRNGCDRNRSLWSSWSFITDKYRTFFSGDTAYCEAFEAVGRRYGPFDLAAIAIGAYCPRYFMSNQHIDPEQALKVHHELRSKLSFGIHWGTYDMGSTEPCMEPKQLIEEYQSGKETTFITIDHGAIHTTGDEKEETELSSNSVKST